MPFNLNRKPVLCKSVVCIKKCDAGGINLTETSQILLFYEQINSNFT